MSMSIGYVAGFVAIVLLFVYGKTVLRVRGLRLRRELTHRFVERRDVPADVLGLLETQARSLEALGFEPFAFSNTPSNVDGDEQPTWFLILRHARDRSFALLSMSAMPSRTRPCDLWFQSFTEDGRSLETVDFAMCPPPADDDHVLIDAQTPTFADQWERHRQEVAARQLDARDLTRDELREACSEDRRLALERAVDAGQYTREADGRLRFTLRYACSAVASSTARDSRKRTAIAKQQKALRAQGVLPPSETASAASEPQVTAEVWAHRRRQGVESSRRQAGWLKKLVIFLASVAAFAVAFGIQLSFDRVVMIFAVLMVHELGHALAMKAFGYRDLQILFIPFLGAVASGKSHSPKPYQELIVLLAGPVPGIVVGSYLMLWGSAEWPAWIPDLAWLMLIVNYMNLLPILPLDGGRIMSLALFDRFPKLQLGFAALSGFALTVFGRMQNDTVLSALGILMVVAIPAQLKSTRVFDRARKRLAQLAPASKPADPLPALYTELQDPRFDSLNSESKYQMVVSLMERLSRKPAGAGLALLSICVWVGFLILPVGMIQYRATSAFAEAEAEHESKLADADARIAAAESPEDELRARLDAAQSLYEYGDVAQAGLRLEPTAALFGAVQQPELEASVRLLQAQIEIAIGDHLEPDGSLDALTADALSRALELREQRFGEASLEVAEVLETFPAGALGDPVAAIVRQLRLQEIYERVLAEQPDKRWQLLTAHHREALLRSEYQDLGRAEAALLRALAIADGAPKEERIPLQLHVVEELSSFYLLQQRWSEVAPLLDRRDALYREQFAENGDDFIGVDSERCWLAYWQGAESTGHCFGELHTRVMESEIGEVAGEVAGLQHRVDQATATRRAGDDASALKLLAMREDESRESLEMYLSSLSEMEGVADDSFVAREEIRRNAERSRLLEPLRAQLASTTP